MRRCRCMLAVAAALLVLPAGTASQSPAVEPAVVLRPGDRVKIEVWRRVELSGEFDVRTDGRLSHPLYQEVPVAGLGVSEIEAAIRQFLRGFESEPQVTIEILLRVAVSGEVRQPGLHTVSAGTTIADAIMEAGGPTESGRLTKVVVFRGGSESELDVTMGAAREATIRSGDVIMLPRRSSVLRDAIGPIASVIGALAAVVNIIRR